MVCDVFGDINQYNIWIVLVAIGHVLVAVKSVFDKHVLSWRNTVEGKHAIRISRSVAVENRSSVVIDDTKFDCDLRDWGIASVIAVNIFQHLTSNLAALLVNKVVSSGVLTTYKCNRDDIRVSTVGVLYIQRHPCKVGLDDGVVTGGQVVEHILAVAVSESRGNNLIVLVLEYNQNTWQVVVTGVVIVDIFLNITRD